MKAEQISSAERSGLSKRLRTASAVVATALFLSACAVGPRTQVVPYRPQGTSQQQHDVNIAVCEKWAREQYGARPYRGVDEGARGAAGLAAIGALIGGLAGGWRGAGVGAAAGAGAGALAGGVYGSQQAQDTYTMAFNDCMSKR